MISGVAHELNNPLASIIGYAQLVAATGRDEKLASRLETMRREAERCRRIVENLLSFARRREPESKPLALNQSVRNVCSLLDYQLRVDDVSIETELSPELPTIQGDAHQLEQVLVNLLTNAHHAIRQTGRAGRVWIRTTVDAGGVLLEIADDGPGIPEAIRSRVFDPFFTTKDPGQGTGLGLSLVYGIVTAHGGTIELQPRSPGGTVFRLRFEARTASRSERQEPDAVQRPFRSGRILVVDDEEPLARMICDALSTDGHVAEWASNGQVALERVGQGEFDVIITDLRMPVMDGERLSNELCARRPELASRILLTTGDTLGERAADVAERTGLEVLRKPFDLEELRARVRERLGS
jgi:CheY-like chemotaxis protein/anti-sigma regulatory factor (Ser/Thr protein kinase)